MKTTFPVISLARSSKAFLSLLNGNSAAVLLIFRLRLGRRPNEVSPMFKLIQPLKLGSLGNFPSSTEIEHSLTMIN